MKKQDNKRATFIDQKLVQEEKVTRMENLKEGLDDKFKEISHNNEQTEIENRRVNIRKFKSQSKNSSFK